MRNVLLVESADIAWPSVRAMLYGMPDVQIVGGAFDGEDALGLAGGLLPDVVIAPVTIAGQTSLGFIRTIRQLYPNSFIIILGSRYNPEELVPFVEAGARGYLLWTEHDADFLEQCLRVAISGQVIIGSVPAGEAFFEAVLMKAHADAMLQLTPRERAVLGLLVQRLTDKEIAERLRISPSTVTNHIQSLYTKLGARTRFDLGMIAAARGLVKTRDMVPPAAESLD